MTGHPPRFSETFTNDGESSPR
ncbi:MAG: hypothetical protein QOD51_2413, partial [Candidatus Eremiobacteraeota bacterium]|nr:hypothetical protein [Candidatus Eremiobacteraeota bacterium]